jgi:hypothetical protein
MPESGNRQQCCENSDLHGSWDSANEVFEISHADFEVSLRLKHYPQAPLRRLQSTRKGSQRGIPKLRQRSRGTTRPTKLRRPVPPRQKTESIEYVRLEGITDQNGDFYKWNRRAGDDGNWEDKRKEPVDVVAILEKSKARLRMKVRPGGAKLPFDLCSSDTGTCFEGEVQDVGRLQVSDKVMIEMCKDPQRRDGFQATCHYQ